MTAASFAELARSVAAPPPRLGPVRLVAVDGPSGAGKSWFAARLGRALGGAPIVHTDDLLDGWDDQFTFWDRLDARVLEPLRHGRPGSYQKYRWHSGGFGGRPVTVPPAPVVIVEGVSSARRAIRPELGLAVFVTAPADLRLRRALARDDGGDVVAFRAYLERWRSREDRHFTADATVAHADLLVDGAAEGHDDEFEQIWRRPPHRAAKRRHGSEDGD